MDVDLYSLSSRDCALSLQKAIQDLGYSCNLFDYTEVKNSAAKKINILNIEKQMFDQDSKRLLQNTEQLFDVIFVDSPDIMRETDICSIGLNFCCWPTNDSELMLRILHAVKIKKVSTNVNLELVEELCLSVNMVGQSATFKKVLGRIKKFSCHEANVLILGETGTGKELAARAIHYLSTRKNGPFQAVNCGALPEQIIENELFGHVPGAFTDAKYAQTGMVELANKGSLFLDEIDALSLKSQASLLRFLQDRIYRPLGSKHCQNANVRVIAASNADLEQLAREGRFRKDLLYRLNLLSFRLPLLKERKDDILLLTEHFLHESETEYKEGKKVFHPYALQIMRDYSWPGNVRELRNFVHREYLLADSPLITATPDKQNEAVFEVSDTQSLIDTGLASFNVAKQQVIMHFERDYLTRILDKAGGNVTLAARLAGKERREFGKLIKKHGIERQQFSH